MRYHVKFLKPNKQAVYHETIPDNATNLVRAKAEATHTKKIADYLLFAATERKTREFILAIIEGT